MGIDSDQIIRREIENMKEEDPTNLNKAGLIDFDILMVKVLHYFRLSVNKTKIYVINAFAASDLDGNGMCNLEEWLLLNRHIEPLKFDEAKLSDLFFDHADLEENEEKNLSFERFTILCLQ